VLMLDVSLIAAAHCTPHGRAAMMWAFLLAESLSLDAKQLQVAMQAASPHVTLAMHAGSF